MSPRVSLCLGLVLGSAVGFAAALSIHSAGAQHHGHAAHATDSPAVAAFQAANDRMHRDMAIPYTGDADRDFVASMIPHHQGAIDMAKVVLQYGKDPEIRQLAGAIVTAQEKEIAEMRAWQQKLGTR